MLPDIALEALRYFDRTTLEGLQMHARYLRDLVNHHARSLPLRRIHLVLVRDPAPDCLFTELVGVDVVESCAISIGLDPSPWIGKFIEEFKTAGLGTDVVRSVSLLYKRYREDASLPLDLEPLGQPWRTDVPSPHCELIE